MDSIIFEAPLNSLSFGNVSLNILREAYRKGLSVSLFPINNTIDLSVYDSLDQDFKDWINDSHKSRLSGVSNYSKSLKLWHLNGSEMRVGKNQSLYTFYEASKPTDIEKKLCELQDNTIFSSSYAQSLFKDYGKVDYVPPGFDTDFKKKNKTPLPDKIHFGLMGKWELRKNTCKIIRAWAKKYGDNYKYQLSCCVTNPFFEIKKMNQEISECLNGKHYGNINFIPFLKTNSEVNDFLNSIDIDLTGLSGAEGWNLPAFNSTCLGKWSVVLNCTAHKDWANSKNCILVEPEGTESIEDNIFFKNNADFNQGHRYSISEDKIIEKLELSEDFINNNNTEGEKLRDEFSYEKTLNSLLDII